MALPTFLASLVAFGMVIGSALAQSAPCDQALPLNPGLGFDGPIIAQAVFDDDGPGPNPARLFVSYRVWQVGAVAHHIARWDGSQWSSVGTGQTPVTAGPMRVFDDGRGPALFVGGRSSEIPPVGDSPAPLYRWDGSQWTQVLIPWYGGLPSWVSAMVVFDPDGPGPLPACLHLTLSYMFTEGPTNGYVLVYRYDGTTFTQIGGSVLEMGSVSALVPFDPDGPGPANYDLYLAGSTASIHEGGPFPVLHRIREGGSTVIAMGTQQQEYDALTVFDPDEAGPLLPRLYVGGSFDSIGGVPARHIASWDGANWAPADAGLNADTRAVAGLTTFDPDGAGPQRRLLVAVDVRSQIAQTSVAFISAFDGTSWAPFGPGLTGRFSQIPSSVFNMREFDPGTNGPGFPILSITGEFNGVQGQAASRWVALQGDGVVGPSPGPAGPINALAIFNDGHGRDLFAGGSFVRAGPIAAANIARWDGTSWAALGSGVQPTALVPAPVINALAVHDDGSGWALYAAGTFAQAGGRNVSNIARWDGQAWSAVGAMGLANGDVLALEVHDPDGPGPLPPRLYAGGSFTLADGQPVPHLAMWDGASWSAVGGGVTGTVRALRSFDDGSGPALYVGGDLFAATGIVSNRAAKWTGTQWSALPPILQGEIDAFGIHDDGTGFALYAAGYYPAWAPGVYGSVARLLGGQWQALPAQQAPNAPKVLRSIADGDRRALYVGSDDALHPISRFADGVWSTITPVVNGPVRALTPAFDDGKGLSFFAAGMFIAVGSDATSFLVRIPVCPCYANCDGSTTPPVLNINDFVCFLDRAAAGDSYANCDQSTTPPVLNVNDFVCFLNAFAAGCP